MSDKKATTVKIKRVRGAVQTGVRAGLNRTRQKELLTLTMTGIG